MSVKSKANLTTTNNTSITDNVNRENTSTRVRGLVQDVIDSSYNYNDDPLLWTTLPEFITQIDPTLSLLTQTHYIYPTDGSTILQYEFLGTYPMDARGVFYYDTKGTQTVTADIYPEKYSSMSVSLLINGYDYTSSKCCTYEILCSYGHYSSGIHGTSSVVHSFSDFSTANANVTIGSTLDHIEINFVGEGSNNINWICRYEILKQHFRI